MHQLHPIAYVLLGAVLLTVLKYLAKFLKLSPKDQGEYIFIQALLHWKLIGSLFVIGLLALGIYLGKHI